MFGRSSSQTRTGIALALLLATFSQRLKNPTPSTTLRYLKDSKASKQPFNLYASMSLFGELYPMCFEYPEMVRFYHSVYRVVYHPQVQNIDPFVCVVDGGGKGRGVTDS